MLAQCLSPSTHFAVILLEYFPPLTHSLRHVYILTLIFYLSRPEAQFNKIKMSQPAREAFLTAMNRGAKSKINREKLTYLMGQGESMLNTQEYRVCTMWIDVCYSRGLGISFKLFVLEKNEKCFCPRLTIKTCSLDSFQNVLNKIRFGSSEMCSCKGIC